MKAINELKKIFPDFGIDFYLVPSQDEFLGEYTTEHSNRIKYITGFSGSNGMAVFSATDQDCFFTDGRYLIQARSELLGDFEIIDISNLSDWIIAKCKDGKKIGIDPNLHSILETENLLKKGLLVFIEQNLVDLVWIDRPSREYSHIFLHPLDYSGQDIKDKKESVVERIKQNGLDAIIISDPHSLCWLLNIRGRDLENTPIILSRAILYREGLIDLFSSNPLDSKVQEYFSANNIRVFKEEEFDSSLQRLSNQKIGINPKSPYSIKLKLQNAILVDEYCEQLRAIKNYTEIKGAISAHLKDGRAVSGLIEWIRTTQNLTELDVSAKAQALRSEEKNFVCPSFPTIAGFKGNGAIIHYRPAESTNLEIKKDGILLIDSGGQYLEGTTDITRTIAIGTPTEEQIHNFTLVLKGAIRLMTAKFKHGTSGAELDALARQDLLQEGKNYVHGTGHGVGSFLSVHEYPRSIASAILEPGMIVSVEPGFYKEGEYGIRIENLVLVERAQDPEMLEFRLLTLVPIDERLVDFSILTEEERAWLERYNRSCQKVC